MRNRYTDDQLYEAVKASKTIREALASLGVVPAGGNYSTFRFRVAKLKIDTSHFEYRSKPENATVKPSRPLADYLSNTIRISSHALRKRLIKDGVFARECSRCKNTHWVDGLIPLELDHIDGNHENNQLANLRLLCPNCHALTPNYRGRNINRVKVSKKARKRLLKQWEFHCSECNKDLCGKTKTGLCRDCLCQNRRLFKPTKLELENLIGKLPFTQIGKLFNVSDNAVRKRCRSFGIAI